MKYERFSDNISIVIGENGENQVLTASTRKNQKILSLNTRLSNILLIEFTLCIVLLVAACFLLMKQNDAIYRQGIRSSVPIVLSTIYYGCGLIVTYLNNYSGLYFIAWLGILQVMSLCANVFTNTLAIIEHGANDEHTVIVFHVGLIISIISVIQAILMIFLVNLTFNLLRLLKTLKPNNIEQI